MDKDARKKTRQLYWAMGITLFGLGGLGIGLMYAFVPEGRKALSGLGFAEWYKAIVAGTLFAALSLPFLVGLLETPFLQPTRRFFAALMADYRVRWWQIWLLSACAGIGEEILFRGALQPLLGLPLTALLFVFLHGYLNPLNRPLFLYGILLCLVSAGFGYLFVAFSLPAAMIAHFWIDVVLLYYLRRHRPQAE